jgi:hypothetical protein
MAEKGEGLHSTVLPTRGADETAAVVALHVQAFLNKLAGSVRSLSMPSLGRCDAWEEKKKTTMAVSKPTMTAGPDASSMAVLGMLKRQQLLLLLRALSLPAACGGLTAASASGAEGAAAMLIFAEGRALLRRKKRGQESCESLRRGKPKPGFLSSLVFHFQSICFFFLLFFPMLSRSLVAHRPCAPQRMRPAPAMAPQSISLAATSPRAERRAVARLEARQRIPSPSSSRSHSINIAAASNLDDDLTSSGEDLAYETCSPGYVTFDNASSPTCTKLHLEASDYIGLTRVVAWVLGGLGLLVRDARLATGDDGWAKNEFWVTTEAGAKLSDGRAQAASERLAEFVTYCTPPPRRAGEEPRCEAGGIRVDSSARAHKKWTVVTVRNSSSGSKGSTSSSSPLLDVASAVSGAGIEIREAIVQGGPACGVDGGGFGGTGDRPTIDEDPEDDEEVSSSSSSSASSISEPAMRLWVCEPATGGKLSYVRCAALLQTLSLALGRGGGPSLVPPAPVSLVRE